MKLIKFLLLFSIAIGNVIFAMDFESKTEKLPKSDLTPEQFKQEWNKLKTKKELEKITGKDVTSFQDTQKIIAQKIITPVIAYIVKKPSFAELKHGRFNRNAYVVTAAFSADGNKLAVVVEEQNLFAPGSKIIVWDVITASKLAEINPKDFSAISTKLHARQVNSIAFSPDGKKLVTGSQDGTVKIWNIQTKKKKTYLRFILKVQDLLRNILCEIKFQLIMYHLTQMGAEFLL